MRLKTLPWIETAPITAGTRVIVRASLNVPLINGEPADTSRLTAMIPTLQYLKKIGARTVVIGHIGRNEDATLAPVARALQKEISLAFMPRSIGDDVTEVVNELTDGEVVMLENIRQHKEEKENNEMFSTQLAQYGDIYICDAFADAHRAHASLVGLAQKLPTYFGYSFKKEYEGLHTALSPETPSLAVLGGAKFETKLPLLKNLAEKYTHIFLGGALMNEYLHAYGYAIGKSLVSSDDTVAEKIKNYPHIIMPIDVTVWNGKNVRIASITDIHDDEYIYDIGPKTFARLSTYVTKAQTILWNGPLGYYEGGYDYFTKQCAQAIAVHHGQTIVGGGDTVAAIHDQKLENAFTHISTAGGAMLDFLAAGTLPIIEVVQSKTYV